MRRVVELITQVRRVAVWIIYPVSYFCTGSIPGQRAIFWLRYHSLTHLPANTPLTRSHHFAELYHLPANTPLTRSHHFAELYHVPANTPCTNTLTPLCWVVSRSSQCTTNTLAPLCWGVSRSANAPITRSHHFAEKFHPRVSSVLLKF